MRIEVYLKGQGQTIQGFIRAVADALAAPLYPVIWVVGTILCVMSGPFGTGAALDLAGRSLYWSVTVGLSVLLGAAARELLRPLPALRPRIRFEFAVALLMTVLLGPILAWLTDAVLGPAQTGPGLGRMTLYVLVTSLVIASVLSAIPQPAASERSAPEASGPRLLQRLSEELRAPIVKMQVRDHYVEVTTRKGVGMVLMRFGDALAEVEGSDGIQVHRSHWVAREAMVATVRYGNRTLLMLRDGSAIPVSRTYLPAVSELELEERDAAAAE